MLEHKRSISRRTDASFSVLRFLVFSGLLVLRIMVDIGTYGVGSCMRNCKSDGTSNFEYKEYIVFLSH